MKSTFSLALISKHIFTTTRAAKQVLRLPPNHGPTLSPIQLRTLQVPRGFLQYPLQFPFFTFAILASFLWSSLPPPSLRKMSSRPPTPPSKAPWDDEDFRFKTSGTPCEWGEIYHPGGYYLVHLDDFV
ncbi:hypothetical protein BFJ70_g8102 [Fusarium oxysporum]|nr:hypothetical protein BFJ70_g8102 [Fusarium oxysporum]